MIFVPSSVSVAVNLIRLYHKIVQIIAKVVDVHACSLHSDMLKEIYLAFHHNFFCNVTKQRIERTLTIHVLIQDYQPVFL